MGNTSSPAVDPKPVDGSLLHNRGAAAVDTSVEKHDAGRCREMNANFDAVLDLVKQSDRAEQNCQFEEAVFFRSRALEILLNELRHADSGSERAMVLAAECEKLLSQTEKAKARLQGSSKDDIERLRQQRRDDTKYLEEMGFPRKEVIDALTKSNWTRELALAQLLDKPPPKSPVIKHSKSEPTPKSPPANKGSVQFTRSAEEAVVLSDMHHDIARIKWSDIVGLGYAKQGTFLIPRLAN